MLGGALVVAGIARHLKGGGLRPQRRPKVLVSSRMRGAGPVPVNVGLREGQRKEPPTRARALVGVPVRALVPCVVDNRQDRGCAEVERRAGEDGETLGRRTIHDRGP
jgi:hypothetical protein